MIEFNYMNHDRQKMLGNKPIGKLLWQFALPASVGMFVMALYNIVDTIFIGRVVGPLGIAGLTIVFPVQMLVMSLGGMIGIGGASIISRALGAKDINKAERTLGNVIFSASLVGLLITAVALPNSSFWLQLLGTTDAILPFAKEYMDIILIGAVFQTYVFAVNNAIRAEGNARVAMLAMVIGALTNIGLDALFILKLGMGISGAATATVFRCFVICKNGFK